MNKKFWAKLYFFQLQYAATIKRQTFTFFHIESNISPSNCLTVKVPRKPVPVKTFKTFLVSVHRNLPVLAKLFAFEDAPSHFTELNTFWGKFRVWAGRKTKGNNDKLFLWLVILKDGTWPCFDNIGSETNSRITSEPLPLRTSILQKLRLHL